MTDTPRENWKIEIDSVDDVFDFPYWTIESKAHGIRMRADSVAELQAAIAGIIGAIQMKYSAAADAHAKVVAFLDPKHDGDFDLRFLGKDAFHGPDDAA
jgi:hypothetical protein